jgi:hypothetical protein
MCSLATMLLDVIYGALEAINVVFHPADAMIAGVAQ